ncbi:MAG: hypothetical protein KAS96_03050 [Planctomycetes bacterium]|nr:hypothetical protein [Planctomycetota bacterium]
MRKVFLTTLIVILVTGIAYGGYDVNDVFIKGDSTLMGMKIESSYFDNGAFLIETTGARFEYANGQLKLYQGLDSKNRRLLSTVIFDNEPNFIKVQSNYDHIIFWSKDLNIGIYGDSTLIISPKVKQDLKCIGNFKPDYEGIYKGELLLIDDLGGMEIYPQRYEAGYEIKRIELGKSDWIADYQLNAGERVMVAAFPGRPFDWEGSFKCNILFTYGSRGLGHGNVYGQMPPDNRVQKWADEGFNILVIFHEGIYGDIPSKPYPIPCGPYEVVNKPEFERVIRATHASGMRFSPYVSLFYSYYKFRDVELFYTQVEALRNEFGIDGVYIDGLLAEDVENKIDDKIASWEMIRRLRRLFGPNGSIICHGTNRGSKVAAVPNIDSYCTATLNGEGVAFSGPNDPYVQYLVRKYGISNTVALWLPRLSIGPKNFTYNDIINTLLAMNGRQFSWGGVDVLEPPKDNKYVWHNGTFDGFKKYMRRLSILKNKYNRN